MQLMLGRDHGVEAVQHPLGRCLEVSGRYSGRPSGVALVYVLQLLSFRDLSLQVCADRPISAHNLLLSERQRAHMVAPHHRYRP